MKTSPLLLTAALFVCHSYGQAPEAPKPAEGSAPPAKRTLLKYTPPKTAGSGARIDGDGGSRGPGKKLPSLYVLAPNHTALTTREQPSLFWYQTAAANTHFELTLTEPKNPKPLLKVATDKADGGIHRVSLAKNKVTLKPGVAYKWTIAWVPDAANRSQDVIASGSIERSEPEAKLTAELANAKGVEKAAVYAQNGIWYDALEALSNEIDASPKSKDLHAQRAALLEQAGLKDAAASERR
jgi:hypothetical protein